MRRFSAKPESIPESPKQDKSQQLLGFKVFKVLFLATLLYVMGLIAWSMILDVWNSLLELAALAARFSCWRTLSISLVLIGLLLGSFTQGVIPITYAGGEVSPSVDNVMPMAAREASYEPDIISNETPEQQIDVGPTLYHLPFSKLAMSNEAS